MGEIVVLALVVILFMATLLALFGDYRRSQGVFRKKYPPISDAEFVALCTPGTRPEVALKVRRIFAERMAVEYERVHPSMNFIEDMGAD